MRALTGLNRPFMKRRLPVLNLFYRGRVSRLVPTEIQCFGTECTYVWTPPEWTRTTKKVGCVGWSLHDRQRLDGLEENDGRYDGIERDGSRDDARGGVVKDAVAG